MSNLKKKQQQSTSDVINSAIEKVCF